MKRRFIVPILILLAGLLPAQIQRIAEADPDSPVPAAIRNNGYFLESLRLTLLAEEAYAIGDYDASTQYAEDAVRYAELSDEWVLLQLKIRETDNAIAAARHRLDFATAVNAAERFPDEYLLATQAFEEARSHRAFERWDPAIEAANRVLEFLAMVDDQMGPLPLPSQYVVRPWTTFRDSLWYIAGQSWAYNDPWQWRRLYEANRDRMPEPDNPDLIHPGMILNIPSIRGETRSGTWNAEGTYVPLP
ncbi:MAG: LysM peptidoglycan-binding domain-containing protein [Treponema sp.]|nr:LysM peptidoglycan-binding domain-containing protein [Treponema sp.]